MSKPFTTEAIRAAYLSFMSERGHVIIDPASLLPAENSTLFTGSGMQPLLPYLLGEAHPSGNRLADSQPCIRAQDIEEVGDNRHTTFFEMLGNWSLGSYSKTEQIEWFFTFLTDVVGLDPQRLYVTCFIGDETHGIPRDDISARLWQRLFQNRGLQADIAVIGSQADGNGRGMRPGERIFFYDADENWWSRGDGLLGTPLGDPCGPDSEVFYDFGSDYHDPEYGFAHPAIDSGQFMEIGNQVFMEYRRDMDGSFKPLGRPQVDFGGGLERIAAAALQTPDVYRGSLLWPIVALTATLANTDYEDDPQPLRIIADHLRGSVFLAVNGVVPGNKQQGYVMRRLLRKAITTAHRLGLTGEFFEPVVNKIIDMYEIAYPQLGSQRAHIINVFVREERSFQRTLNMGLRLLERYSEGTLTGADVFLLADTHGFPRELTVELASERGIMLATNWEAEFDQLRSIQRTRSKG